MAQQYIKTVGSAIPQDFPSSLVEDVSPMLTMLDPNDTPFSSRIRSKMTKSNVPEWGIDFLEAPNPVRRPYGLNVNVDAPFVAGSNPKRRSNVIAVIARAFSVSVEELATKHHWYTNRINYETNKQLAAMKREQEIMCLENRAANQGNTSATPFNGIETFSTYSANTTGAVKYVGQFSGVPTFPESNVVQPSEATVGGWNDARKAHLARTPADADDSGTSHLEDFTEESIIALAQAVITNNGTGGMGRKTLMGNANQIENFSRAGASISEGSSGVQRFVGGNSRKGVGKINKIDFYDTNYGIFRFMTNPWMDMRTVYLLQFDAWQKKVLVKMRRTRLAVQGNTHDFLLTLAFTICLNNEQNMGAMFDRNPGTWSKGVKDYWSSGVGNGAYDGTWKGLTGQWTGAIAGAYPGFADATKAAAEVAAWRKPRLQGGIDA